MGGSVSSPQLSTPVFKLFLRHCPTAARLEHTRDKKRKGKKKKRGGGREKSSKVARSRKEEICSHPLFADCEGSSTAAMHAATLDGCSGAALRRC